MQGDAQHIVYSNVSRYDKVVGVGGVRARVRDGEEQGWLHVCGLFPGRNQRYAHSLHARLLGHAEAVLSQQWFVRMFELCFGMLSNFLAGITVVGANASS